MELPEDPIMLMSVVNTRLRDRYASLDALCDDLNVAREALETSLRAVGYTYDPDANRFQ